MEHTKADGQAQDNVADGSDAASQGQCKPAPSASLYTQAADALEAAERRAEEAEATIRYERDRNLEKVKTARMRQEEAERKLAEAVGLLHDIKKHAPCYIIHGAVYEIHHLTGRVDDFLTKHGGGK